MTSPKPPNPLICPTIEDIPGKVSLLVMRRDHTHSSIRRQESSMAFVAGTSRGIAFAEELAKDRAWLATVECSITALEFVAAFSLATLREGVREDPAVDRTAAWDAYLRARTAVIKAMRAGGYKDGEIVDSINLDGEAHARRIGVEPPGPNHPDPDVAIDAFVEREVRALRRPGDSVAVTQILMAAALTAIDRAPRRADGTIDADVAHATLHKAIARAPLATDATRVDASAALAGITTTAAEWKRRYQDLEHRLGGEVAALRQALEVTTAQRDAAQTAKELVDKLVAAEEVPEPAPDDIVDGVDVAELEDERDEAEEERDAALAKMRETRGELRRIRREMNRRSTELETAFRCGIEAAEGRLDMTNAQIEEAVASWKANNS